MVDKKILIVVMAVSFTMVLLFANWMTDDSILAIVFWSSFIVFALCVRHLEKNKKYYEEDDDML